MKLYHFTYEEALPSILAEGLYRGEIPLSRTTIMPESAVWLTTDQTPDGHGLGYAHARVATPELAAAYKVPVGTTLHFPDKKKIRIQVDFKTSKARGLHKWLDFAKKEKIDRDWLKRLHAGAGDNPRPNTWWLYLGTLPPQTFQAIEVRTPDGVYASVLERPDLLEFVRFERTAA